MIKVIVHEEVTVVVDGEEHCVTFTAEETWTWLDHGIGSYDYFGAYGVHEDWQWDFNEVVVYDIVKHEFMNEHNMTLTHPIDSLNKEFADKLNAACLDYAKDNAVEPDKSEGYDDNDDFCEEDLYPSYDPGYHPYD